MSSATFVENETHLFEKKIGGHITILFTEFKKITRFYVLFHLFFAVLALAEIFSFAVFFSFWIHSAAIAFLIASFLLGGFSYFVLLSYFQTKKPQQLYELCQTFLTGCHGHLCTDDHLSLAHAIYRAVQQLDRMEGDYYVLPFSWNTLNTLLKKFSIYCHWYDVLKMKELLLFEALSEHLQLIKKEPTDLEAHAALAEGYLKLASLYKEPTTTEEDAPPWIPPYYTTKPMLDKLTKTCERAIEEFKIIEAYVPRDPWVHAQLANVYHDLGEAEKEISEYETMLKISPQDRTVMFHLGVLYFQQGKTAQGLQMYDHLHKLRDDKAPVLLSYYDIYDIRKHFD
ncbi:MAG: hypothetical protein KGZ39_07845 [Simkania sp.]|nr:hypothetical protein [Simkania sp.]